MATTLTLDELRERIGIDREPTAWIRIDQGRIDRFADATGDHQLIHVDPDRAAATPFGSTIAHGYLTLSLLPHLVAESALLPTGTVMGINYGLNRVRFLQPVPVDSEVRARSRLLDVREKGSGRVLLTSEVAVEIRGQERPALLAETLAMFVVADSEETA